MITYDRARNYKAARRIIFFDNTSVVELHGNRSKVIQAMDNNWIIKFSDIIEIVWTGRFRNNKHSNSGWLNEVEESNDIQRDLDDRHGKSERTIEKIDNIDGMNVKILTYFSAIKLSMPFVNRILMFENCCINFCGIHSSI